MMWKVWSVLIYCQTLKECLSYSERVLAEALPVLNGYCPHESEGFTFCLQVSNSPFKTAGACATHPYSSVKLSCKDRFTFHTELRGYL